MISNERSFGTSEVTIGYRQMLVGEKKISLALKKNWRGSFVRLIVDEGGWYEAIIIPVVAVEEFRTCVGEVTRLSVKGQVEIGGRAIFVRVEENSGCLLIGEHSSKRNISVNIPPAGIDEFKKMLGELVDLARQPQVKKQLQESTLYSANLAGDAKSLQFMLKENERGH